MEFDSDTEQLDESHSKETPRGSVSEPRSSNNTNNRKKGMKTYKMEESFGVEQPKKFNGRKSNNTNNRKSHTNNERDSEESSEEESSYYSESSYSETSKSKPTNKSHNKTQTEKSMTAKSGNNSHLKHRKSV